MADVDYRSQVDAIVAGNEAPEGVVFEIIDRDWEYLDRAMPEIQELVSKLRERFPSIDIAVVSHGFEQFGLTTPQLNANEPLKKSVQSLVDSDIPVHVCGTFADWQGVDQSSFHKLVDVSPAGPAQINDYISLGYVKVVVTSNVEFD
jgi:intracellular sulfur oxidation DsrE/DsrF family protein